MKGEGRFFFSSFFFFIFAIIFHRVTLETINRLFKFLFHQVYETNSYEYNSWKGNSFQLNLFKKNIGILLKKKDKFLSMEFHNSKFLTRINSNVINSSLFFTKTLKYIFLSLIKFQLFLINYEFQLHMFNCEINFRLNFW